MGHHELIDFLETHYEVSVFINDELNKYDDTNVIQEYHKGGTGAMYELAHAWTKEFHDMTSSRSWGDEEFLDELYKFLNTKRKYVEATR